MVASRPLCLARRSSSGGDTNNRSDVFVRDRTLRTTTRVSVASDGTESNLISHGPAISADGRYVAFWTAASNLVSGDTNNQNDVFVHDRATGITTRVSVTSAGGEGRASPLTTGSTLPDISDDGRYVVFQSTTAYVDDDVSGEDIYVDDRQGGTTTRVSAPSLSQSAAGRSRDAAISADGRFVAFASTVPNLVDGDTNGVPDSSAGEDVFVRDRTTGAITRVSVATGGTQSNDHSRRPAISADGRHVAFVSRATNLVGGDTNGTGDIFAHDRQTATTVRVSVGSGGTQSTGGSIFEQPSISADGRRVAFESSASDLVGGDSNTSTDVFVHDRQAVTTIRVSVANDGTEGGRGDSRALGPSLSADGTVVAFASRAPDLAGGDINTITSDVFVRDTEAGGIEPLKPVLAVGDVRVFEGDEATRAALFTVTLSKPTTATVTAAFKTVNGTATKAGDDYAGRSGTLSFAPGTTSLTVKVPVRGDRSDEPNESFTLRLSNVAKAIVGDYAGVGTIYDDYPATITGGYGIAASDVTVYEGDAGARNAVFTVSLARPRTSEVTVSFATANGVTGSPALPPATAPGDYTPLEPGTLTFAPGVTSLTVKVPIISDNATEASETFRLILTNPSNGTYLAKSEGLGTIVDDD